MQKHIFSMWDESIDASKSEEFSMKGVSMQKLLRQILAYLNFKAYFKLYGIF